MLIEAFKRWRWNRSRRIYRYWDGQKQRAADPIELSLALANDPQYLRRNLHEALSGNRESIEIVIGAAKRVFGVQEFKDGKGLTRAEMVRLVTDFEMYCQALKKNTMRSSG
jgi:hypothetical protein